MSPENQPAPLPASLNPLVQPPAIPVTSPSRFPLETRLVQGETAQPMNP